MNTSLEIKITANVITGEIAVETGDWTDNDARWELITGADGSLSNATSVEPWGEEELGMERATEAIRDILGFTVGEWTNDGDTSRTTVTGRAA
jgi:hypothetical protein